MDSSTPEEEKKKKNDHNPEFRKLSNDVATRKYRRRSASSSSSDDGSPRRGRSSSPVVGRGHSDRVSDRTSGRKGVGRELLERDSGRYQSTRGGDSQRQHDRPSSRGGSHRHDDYNYRYDKHADDEDRHRRVSSRYGREAARLDHGSEDNDRDRHRDSRDGLGRRGRGDRMKDRERDRDRDDRRDCRRSLEDRKIDQREQSRGHPIESSGREKDRYCSRESNKNGDRDLDAMKEKEQRSRDPKKVADDRDSRPKKPKLFDSSSDADDNKNGAEQKPKAEQPHADTSVVDNDLNAAKVAALKAAELVNKNLVGASFMSTEQKKKLLWGNKKSTASEEAAPKWNTSMFGDRERQEKFNKLMGVKGDVKVDSNTDNPDDGDHLEAKKQEELQIDLEKQYTAGLRRRDGRTVGLGL